MATPPSPVLEFPAMLHGLRGIVRREVDAAGKRWAREYLKTGGFTQPRRMLAVPPGEVMYMHAAAEFDIIPRPLWRVNMFMNVFSRLHENLPKEERPGASAAFESFCLSTPWGALDHAASPPPERSAERMADRLAALLRFWEVLQGPRYALWGPEQRYTLEELMEDIYRKTLEAWCPGGPASVREHMALAVERMARATREECLETVLRIIPVLLKDTAKLKHREVLSDPDFLRERLAELPPEDFEDFSSSYTYSVHVQLAAWDRELGRH